jgi:hypothetical protein
LLSGHVEDRMPTRPVESTHEAEPEHPVQERHAAGVESPSADQLQGANGLPREPHVGNADDLSYGDQDIDTAGTAHDDLSPTKSL